MAKGGERQALLCFWGRGGLALGGGGWQDEWQPLPLMMHHTFSTLGCPELDLDGALNLACRHGFRIIELRALANRVDLPVWFEEVYETPEKLAAHLEGHQVKVCAMGTSFRLVGNTEADRAALVEFTRWADALDTGYLRVFDGGATGSGEEMEEAAATLAWWREERMKHFWAVDLMVETHDSLLTSPILTDFFKVAKGTALLWDAHHTWRKGGEDPLLTWKAVRKHTVHVHVKDSVAVPSARHPYTYVLPGDGEFAMKRLKAELQADRYSGVVSLEWERMWHPDLPELDKALYAAARRLWW